MGADGGSSQSPLLSQPTEDWRYWLLGHAKGGLIKPRSFPQRVILLQNLSVKSQNGSLQPQ